MSTFESAYKSLLQGVSQQIPKERLPGQLTSQLNMLSDPVTNLRRRPGAQFMEYLDLETEEEPGLLGWFTDIAGQRVHVLLNTTSGVVTLLDEEYSTVATLPASTYLQTEDTRTIRTSTVGSEFYILNTAQSPTTVPDTTTADPQYSGFVWVPAGAFAKKYELTVTVGAVEFSVSYTTPSGTGGGDAALATPTYIATQLQAALDPSITAVDLDAMATSVQTAIAGVVAAAAATLEDPLDNPLADTAAAVSALEVPARAHVTANQYADAIVDYTAVIAAIDAAQAALVFPNYINTPTIVALRNAYTAARTLIVSLNAALQYEITNAVPPDVLVVYRTGSYIFIESLPGAGALNVKTTTGSAYLIASGAGYVTQQGNLPPLLPDAADGYICSVGSLTLPQYFQYEAARGAWLESGAFNSPKAITNMPVSVGHNGVVWVLNEDDFEGRLAGDDNSNPNPHFLIEGISGISSFQGRLVLLAGNRVLLSGATATRRFYRSTVVSVLDSDPIEVGSSGNSSAKYEYAVPYQRDLLLFSSAYQAVLPSGNAAITPRTATVVQTSTHEVDVSTQPIVAGRTVMYPNPRSADFYGVMELIPSPYTDTQYLSQDSTVHLPKYFGGRCRFSAASSVASIAVFGSTGDANALFVHEYLWDGDQKVQQAWHQWSFEYPIKFAYFAYDRLVLGFYRNGILVICTVDVRAGVLLSGGERKPFLDFWSIEEVVGRELELPAWFVQFNGTTDNVQLAVPTGALAGERLGYTVLDSNTLKTILSYPEGPACIGIPYRSGFAPTPPVVRDFNEIPVSTNKATLLRYALGTKNSAEFKALVMDRNLEDAEAQDVGTLLWSSSELELGRSLYSTEAMSIIPCRTNVNSTVVDIYTEGAGELNITSLEYVLKFNQKIKRR